MKFKNLFLFLILLVIAIFAIGCNPTSKPSSTSSQPSSASGSAALPAWVSGQASQFQLTIPNGQLPYKCSLKPGSTLPEGFTLSNNCVLAGAPILASGSTRSITPPFSVIITDSSSPPLSAELPLTVTIVESAPKLIPVTEGICIVNQECYVQVANAQDGVEPYYFKSDTFREGAPPMGMIIDQDGYLSGTPSKAGTYNFGVCVVDSIGASKCDQTAVVVEEEYTESSAIPVEEPKVPETWSGTLKGSRPVKTALVYCDDAEVEDDLTMTLYFSDSLVRAFQGSDTYNYKLTGGTLSGTERVTKQFSDVQNCAGFGLKDSSSTDVPLAEGGFYQLALTEEGSKVINVIDISPKENNKPLVGSDFINLGLRGVQLRATTISETQISGTFYGWGPFSSSPNQMGTFTLTK